MIKLPKILPEPSLPGHLPPTAKWLSGEGAGSWFVIENGENDLQYKIKRFSPEGMLECVGIFIADKKLNLTMDYSITYPAHCAVVTIIQGRERISCIVVK